jgi:hypothetical protein
MLCDAELRRAVLGCDVRLDELLDGDDSRCGEGCPAVVFADQSKAFERIGLVWLHAILVGWRLARWAVHAFLVLIMGRTICHVRGGWMGPRRELRCGIGMGGAASLLLWNMAYDPVLFGTRKAVSVEDPTLVDDHAALVRGPRQAALAQLFLWAAGHCAGLLMEGHYCGAMEVPIGYLEVRMALEAFPLRIEPAQCSLTRATGAHCGVLSMLAKDFLRLLPIEFRVFQLHACSCQTKTAVVPTHGLQ